MDPALQPNGYNYFLVVHLVVANSIFAGLAVLVYFNWILAAVALWPALWALLSALALWPLKKAIVEMAEVFFDSDEGVLASVTRLLSWPFEQLQFSARMLHVRYIAMVRPLVQPALTRLFRTGGCGRGCARLAAFVFGLWPLMPRSRNSPRVRHEVPSTVPAGAVAEPAGTSELSDGEEGEAAARVRAESRASFVEESFADDIAGLSNLFPGAGSLPLPSSREGSRRSRAQLPPPDTDASQGTHGSRASFIAPHTEPRTLQVQALPTGISPPPGGGTIFWAALSVCYLLYMFVLVWRHYWVWVLLAAGCHIAWNTMRYIAHVKVFHERLLSVQRVGASRRAACATWSRQVNATLLHAPSVTLSLLHSALGNVDSCLQYLRHASQARLRTCLHGCVAALLVATLLCSLTTFSAFFTMEIVYEWQQAVSDTKYVTANG